ncbi:hypothetical protein V7183_18695 [Bacillus sp. JJ1127]|uniref:hypothetical protein n=1 Tax=Bacillus sp. JJ1127 TaxID=3122952 RepID=UPI002FFF1115
MTNIGMESLLRSPLGRKLINDAEKYMNDLKETKAEKVTKLQGLEKLYGELAVGVPEHKNREFYRKVDGVPCIISTNAGGRVHRITPLANYIEDVGQPKSFLAHEIKSSDEITYKRMRANDLPSVSRSDEYYQTEIFGEGQPMEIFDAYITRPSNDPESPRFDADWWKYYEGAESYDAGITQHIKQLNGIYSDENIINVASRIQELKEEIQEIDTQIY